MEGREEKKKTTSMWRQVAFGITANSIVNFRHIRRRVGNYDV